MKVLATAVKEPPATPARRHCLSHHQHQHDDDGDDGDDDDDDDVDDYLDDDDAQAMMIFINLIG